MTGRTSGHVDCVVVGAGVIGLAIARKLARMGREVLVLEAESTFGTATSARNSEVLHAGIYYQPGSLKARLCVAGLHDLYRYCASRGVDHRPTGKIIAAARAEQVPGFETLAARAEANGVKTLRWLTKTEAKALEPALACEAALLSPATGIIDSHGLMLSYLGEAEDAGAMVAYASRLVAGEATANGFSLAIESTGGGDSTITCNALVNSAGLGAWAVSSALKGVAADTVPPHYLCKGNYFLLTGKNPFSHLIYPAPDTASLGIHLTIDLAGQARFGPDQEWVEEIDYAVDPRRGEVFYDAIRSYFPALADRALTPGYAGIRPKLQAPGDPPADFLIHGPADHGGANMVALYGMESPGLTASLAIADHVADLLG